MIRNLAIFANIDRRHRERTIFGEGMAGASLRSPSRVGEMPV
jgi:hypothetical protein